MDLGGRGDKLRQLCLFEMVAVSRYEWLDPYRQDRKMSWISVNGLVLEPCSNSIVSLDVFFSKSCSCNEVGDEETTYRQRQTSVGLVRAADCSQ